MRKLLNTLYVTSAESYLSLDGENVVILREEKEILRVPLHNLEGIIAFGYTGASPALMRACAERGIALSFLAQSGRFLASVKGKTYGNVLLRRQQYRIADDIGQSLSFARNSILGKVFNSRWVLERTVRDHAMRVNSDALKTASIGLKTACDNILQVGSAEELRGIEGKAAAQYFGVFNELVLQNKEEFRFTGRNRRPPLDRINALMSFVYTLLAHETAAALEAVGLDPYVGFFHTDRPGRISLALDLMEELRPIMADRFVISLINLRKIDPSGFDIRENGAVVMDDASRKAVITAWQARKQEKLMHPFLQEEVVWGLVPHAQALLLSRCIRGDLDEYPPFLWK